MAQREQRKNKWNRANGKTLGFEDAPGYAGNNLHPHLGIVESKHVLLVLTALKWISVAFWEEFVALRAAKLQGQSRRIGTNTSMLSFESLSQAFGSIILPAFSLNHTKTSELRLFS